MPRYVAFLRAVNVGGRTVRMEELRRVFAAVPLANVETFIASGNVLFTSPARSLPALEARIEAQLQSALGYAVPTLLRTPAEVRATVDRAPFPAEEVTAAHAVYVIFLRQALAPELEPQVRALDTAMDAFSGSGRELYWLCRGLLSESLVPPASFARVLGRQPTTMRNMTMLRKLAARL